MNRTELNNVKILLSVVLLAIIAALIYDKLTVSTYTSDSGNDKLEETYTPVIVPRKIEVFNRVHDLRENLSSIGIGKVRAWKSDELGWRASSGYFDFGSEGSMGLPNNLAVYLESHSQAYVEAVKLRVNINSSAKQTETYKRYLNAGERVYQVLGIPMSKKLKSAILRGETYQESNKDYTAENIYTPGRIDSWTLKIVSH